MKTFLTYCLISACLLANLEQAKAQTTFTWAKDMPPASGSSQGVKVLKDALGYIYVGGSASVQVDLDPEPGVSLFTGWYIAKYDANGNFVLAFNIPNNNTGGIYVDMDAAGNFYLAGTFSGTLDFDFSPSVANLTANSSYNAYLAKYDNMGNYVWAKQMVTISGSPSASQDNIKVDGSGNCYIYGNIFNGVVDFDPNAGVASFTADASGALYLVKYDANGNFIWIDGFDGNNGTGSIGELVGKLALDGNNGIILTGVFNSPTLDMDPGAGIANLARIALMDCFVARYDAATGAYSWAFNLGTCPYSSLSNYAYFYTPTIALDNTGNVIIATCYSNTVDFDPSTGVTQLVAPSGYRNTFIAKNTNSGNFIWADDLPVNLPNANLKTTRPGVLQTTTNGEIFFAASLEGATDFDPGPGTVTLTQEVPPNVYNTFLARYNTNGNLISAVRLIEGLTGNLGNAGATWGLINDFQISNDAMAIYTTGNFRGTPDFDPTTGVANPITSQTTAVNTGDMFVAKYATGLVTPIKLLSFSGEQKNSQHLLHWQTATEQNNAGFEIQQSGDGVIFSKIGFVASQALLGNSSALLLYSYATDKILPGINYYRLKQIDKDGKYSYSSIIKLSFAKQLQLEMYPNPVANQMVVTGIGPNGNIKIFSADGKLVQQQNTTANTETIQVNKLPKGNYMLQFETGRIKQAIKFVKK